MAYAVPSTHKLMDPIISALDGTGDTYVEEAYVGYKVRTNDAQEFQRVLFTCSGVAATAGAPAVWVDTTEDYVVTSDVSDVADGLMTAAGTGFAGLFTGNNSTNRKYMWIQTKGLAADALVSTGVSANDGLVVEADGFLEKASSITTASGYPLQIVALALEDDTSGVADIMLLGNS